MKALFVNTIALFFSLGLFAQVDANTDEMLVMAEEKKVEASEKIEVSHVRLGAFNEIIETSGVLITESNKTPSYYRHHSKLSSFYSGITVELTTSLLPLPRDYHLFKYFGKVKIFKDGDTYRYIITGYNTKSGAQKHLDTMIKKHAPEARLVIFKKGKIKD